MKDIETTLERVVRRINGLLVAGFKVLDASGQTVWAMNANKLGLIDYWLPNPTDPEMPRVSKQCEPSELSEWRFKDELLTICYTENVENYLRSLKGELELTKAIVANAIQREFNVA